MNPTLTERATKRAFNFNAGPAALPLPVLERIREELLDFAGTGMSVMELSHRSAEFEAMNNKAEEGLRRAMSIPEDYAVLFLQGGGSLQFAMVPMNFYVPGKPVDMIHTGAWTAKAIEELKKIAEMRMAASTEGGEVHARAAAERDQAFARMPPTCTCARTTRSKARKWTEMPETGAVPLVADMSSDILSRPLDVKRFGLIFAGAQKNLGPSGVTVVIVRRDLVERGSDKIAKILQYRTHAKEKSLYNTPPTFAVYMLGLVVEWIGAAGRGDRDREDQRARKRSCSTTRSTAAATTNARWRRTPDRR